MVDRGGVEVFAGDTGVEELGDHTGGEYGYGTGI